MTPLHIHLHHDDNQTTLTLEGEFNRHTADQLEAACTNSNPSTDKPLSLDLSKLTHLTPTGLHSLWQLTKPWIDNHIAITIKGNKQIAPLIELSGFNWLADETCRLHGTQRVSKGQSH